MKIVGGTLGAAWDDERELDCVGDLYLVHRLVRLARGPMPLVTLEGSPASYRHCRVRLTTAGHDVLAGRANAIALRGIDDWVGGIHLDAAAGRLWLRDGDAISGTGD